MTAHVSWPKSVTLLAIREDCMLYPLIDIVRMDTKFVRLQHVHPQIILQNSQGQIATLERNNMHYPYKNIASSAQNWVIVAGAASYYGDVSSHINNIWVGDIPISYCRSDSRPSIRERSLSTCDRPVHITSRWGHQQESGWGRSSSLIPVLIWWGERTDWYRQVRINVLLKFVCSGVGTQS